MAGRLEKKVALVTGGGSGIGKASALAFAKEGAKVVVADVAIEEGQRTVEQLKEAGGDGFAIRTDVTNAAEVASMVSETIEAYGKLDCALNNAGIALGSSVSDCTEEDWNRVLSVNLTGVWLCMKYEIAQMLKQKSGAIVNVASVLGLVGQAEPAPYVASKHGVVGLTKSAAVSYSKAGLRINAVCPGYITTPLIEPNLKDNPDVETHLISLHPIGRLGKSEEVAETVVWLCSDSASFVSGHSMVIDGGYTAQ